MSRPVDLEPYTGLLTRKPELAAALPHDLENHHEPFAEMLIGLRQQKSTEAPFWVGGAANQGAGKTTRGEIYTVLFGTKDLSIYALSIDDLYLSHPDLSQLKKEDSRFESRGVTHNFELVNRTLDDLRKVGNNPILVPGPYDKGAHSGAGDRYLWINPEPGVELTARLIRKETVINGQVQTPPVLHLDRATFRGQSLAISSDMGSITFSTRFYP